MNRGFAIVGALIVSLLAGCGSPPRPPASLSHPAMSGGNPSPGGIEASGGSEPRTAGPTLEQLPTGWHQATVRPVDERAFRAAALERGPIAGEFTPWVTDDKAAWIPASGVGDFSHNGLVSWRGRFVAWADGATIRTSPDGLTWTDATVPPEQSNPWMLVPFSGRLLMLGETFKTTTGAWASDDGSIWTAVGTAPLGMRAAVDAGGFGLVAVGHAGSIPGVWTTATTDAWIDVAEPEGNDQDGTELYGVAAGPGGVVAIGDTAGRAAAWSSRDLATWTRPFDTFGENAYLSSVSNVRGVFLIAGRRKDRAVVWSSPDGRSWAPMELPTSGRTDTEAATITVLGDTLVVFGYTTENAGNGGSSRTGFLVWTLDLAP